MILIIINMQFEETSDQWMGSLLGAQGTQGRGSAAAADKCKFKSVHQDIGEQEERKGDHYVGEGMLFDKHC